MSKFLAELSCSWCLKVLLYRTGNSQLINCNGPILNSYHYSARSSISMFDSRKYIPFSILIIHVHFDQYVFIKILHMKFQSVTKAILSWIAFLMICIHFCNSLGHFWSKNYFVEPYCTLKIQSMYILLINALKLIIKPLWKFLNL